MPTLDELQRPRGMARLLNAAKAEEPQSAVGSQVVGAAASLLPKSRQAEVTPANPPTQAASGPTYPDPPRSITDDECQRNLNNALFWAKSRFAMCGAMQFLQVWGDNGKPVGESGFALTVLGTIPDPQDRTVRFNYHFSHFSASGETKTSELTVKTEVDKRVLISHAKDREGGSIPPTVSFDALEREPSYTHTVVFDAGQGTKPDDLITMAYVPYLSVKYPPQYVVGTVPGPQRVTFAGMNWDAAPYLANAKASDPKKRGGAAFTIMPTLVYSSQQGSPEKAVADHLLLAHTKPGATKPPNPHKNVPGFDYNHPLHRLFYDTKRRRKNRSQAISVCVKYWGKDYAKSDPSGPRECDEYPFASTYEGAAQSIYEPSAPKDNFSAMALAKADNGAAGTILSLFMDKNRIIQGRDANGQELDAFIVAIS
ncbi:hypothetical protein ACFOSC_26425 [Streptantibioticus rubrisoli]|uniref:Deoxyribonuclease NucA/NucB domain-containing protein n=1 Tax=Streptantibioticus rubrisoli TaxID=1387313 RepID=A0ABT1PHK1_9ACTN|nr:hypothetical protein [Streptantibioticus rubrisoli]MCQ4043785.1 hypothetical protein [Streptantibioticus rubrisoli]